MSDTAVPPNLAVLEDVVRRYGLMVKWAIGAAVAATVWITSMTFRVAALEKSMTRVVDTLSPVERALDRIQNRLGIEQPKADK